MFRFLPILFGWWLACVVVALYMALSGCGYHEDAKSPEGESPSLAEKYELYLKLNYQLLESRSGWVTKGCDSLLFTGLRGTYAPVDLTTAKLTPGRWTRRNLAWGDCWPDGSDSQISRDMLLGLGHWILANGRPDLAQEVVDYADRYDGIMGAGDPWRTNIRKPLKATFRLLAGHEDSSTLWPIVVSGAEQGYTRHVAAWHLDLRGKLHGGLGDGYHWWIKEQAREQPQNPLYSFLKARYVTGNFAPVRKDLMNERFWPDGRLPSTKEVCEPWVIQRDRSDDAWEPCPKEKPDHSWTGSAWLAIACRVLERCQADLASRVFLRRSF